MKRNKEKRPGIRRRISLALLLFGAALVLMLWLFQIVFLESFYRSYRIRQVTATADSLKDAIAKAYAAVEKTRFENAFYRRDIGQKALKMER